MIADVTVITPSIPGRGGMRAVAIASVEQQIIKPRAHLIGIDIARKGSARMRNHLAGAADTTWLAPLDDDDVLQPNHLQVLLSGKDNADVVYSYCHVDGRDWTPNRLFDEAALRESNYIPITTLIRRTLWEELDGWHDSARVPNGWEDHDFWVRALNAGATFHCVPAVTWTYRFHHGNKTMLGELVAC